MKTITKLGCVFLGVLAALFPVGASAGTYTSINVTGTISQWDSVPVAIDNAGSSASVLNITTAKFANDDNYFYILVNFGTSVNPNSSLTDGSRSLYLALDNDTNVATGFDIFGAGLNGAEVGWQNDFPFTQTSGTFNTEFGVTGGAAGISPFATDTTFQQIRISRAAVYAGGPLAGQTIFPNNSFRFGFYTQGNGGTEEFTNGLYDFATVPEPSTYALLISASFVGFIILRRRRARA